MFKFLMILLLTCGLALSGWGYISVRDKLDPILEELKAKDQVEYEQMMSKFKGLSYKQGMALYHHLKDTSKAEFVKMRFIEMRNKWLEDKDFRKAEQEKETEERKLSKKGLELENQARLDELNSLSGKDGDKAMRIRWEGSPAWQKSLILREKCNKLLNKEIRSSNNRLDVHRLPGTATRLWVSGGKYDSVAEFCEQMIPIEHSNEGLENVLRLLREEMNYYYFEELASEIGLTKDKSYPPSSRLTRMATDFMD